MWPRVLSTCICQNLKPYTGDGDILSLKNSRVGRKTLHKLKPKDSLVEIGPGVLEKIVKFRWCILAIISPWKLAWPKTFFGWNWPRGSGEDCQILLMYFGYYLPLEFGMALKTNLNPLNKRILFARFGWNWPYGSGEDFLYVVDVILPFRYKGLEPSFQKTWIPFTQGCFVPSLVEIGLVVNFAIIFPWKRV